MNQHLPSGRKFTVAASLLIDVVGYLQRAGIPASQVFAAIGMEPSVLDQPNVRVPGAVIERLWTAGVQLTGDDDLGLHTAENYNPGTLNILGYVLLSCRTAAEALHRLAHYAALLNDGLRVRITRDGDRTNCHFEAIPGEGNYLARAPRQAMETMACGTVVTLRRLTPTHVAPLAVTFQHAAPVVINEHIRIFGPEVSFNQPENLVVFRSADVAAGLLSANPMLLEMFEAQAQQLLAQLHPQGSGPKPVTRRVLDILARRIVVAVPSLDEVAVELAMSERSVQRELRAEDTSFRQLVEDVRKELAVQHLAQPGASATEAAFLLGFSELSAFTRAFRRWTGASPTQFRSA